jgi:hypothetical protein
MCVDEISIAEVLVNDRSKIESYFPGNVGAWLDCYKDSIRRIEHDEPWVTLVSMYALFGDLREKNEQNRIDAFNKILKNCGLKNPPILTEIDKVLVERQFKEVILYRKHLHDKAKENSVFHYYKDRIDKIIEKAKRNQASFEGNTNVDLYIEAKEGDRPVCFFIEAKFLSDISYQVSYSPVRDQISRNIDTGIQYIREEEKPKGFDSLYFLLLTPRLFRTGRYGGNGGSPLQEFNPERSRLYCYKMNDFKDFKLLKASLPHRNNLTDAQWQQLSANLGWITFEEIYQQANNHNTIDPAEKIGIESFFKDRNLI